MITFDLSTSAGRRACVLWHVGRGAPVKAAARLAGVDPRTVTNWRRRFAGYDQQLNTAKRHGKAMYRREVLPLVKNPKRIGPSERLIAERHAAPYLDLIRSGVRPIAAQRQLGIYSSYVTSWRYNIPTFEADYQAALAMHPRPHNPRAVMVARGLAMGLSAADACRASGITRDGVRRWAREGRPEWSIIAPFWPTKRGPKPRPRMLDVAA